MKHFALLLCLIAALAFASTKVHAAVNLQTCTVTPTSGGVMGCPEGSYGFAAVSPSSLVRSQVNRIQGWRAFNSLSSTDQVYASDYAWHSLGSITPALQTTSPSTPPVTPPPVVIPPTGLLVQSVTITLVGGQAPQAVVFSAVASPACFALSTPTGPYKQICMP
jgi:hypothetical protein